jgi:serine/threonine protein phosphatase PrpC
VLFRFSNISHQLDNSLKAERVVYRLYNDENSLVLRPDLGFVAVADGMGGAASGELASAIFTEETSLAFSGIDHDAGRPIAEIVQKTFFSAMRECLKKPMET